METAPAQPKPRNAIRLLRKAMKLVPRDSVAYLNHAKALTTILQQQDLSMDEVEDIWMAALGEEIRDATDESQLRVSEEAVGQDARMTAESVLLYLFNEAFDRDDEDVAAADARGAPPQQVATQPPADARPEAPVDAAGMAERFM
jgi:hypothetical protein